MKVEVKALRMKIFGDVVGAWRIEMHLSTLKV